MTQRTVGVLVMSYGTPQNMEQIEAYYTHIRHGRPPAPEQLQELTERYRAIGGVFPLREHSDRQAAELEQALNRLAGGGGFGVGSAAGAGKAEGTGDEAADGAADGTAAAAADAPSVRYVCYTGLKHAAPFIEDAVRRMAEDGIREAVGVVLAPHYSVMSVGDYAKRAEEAAEPLGIRIRAVRDYHLHPLLIAVLADRLKRGLERFPAERRGDVRILFSAHSLPEKILEMRDPYPDQLLATSKAVAEAAGIPNRWQFAWQSAGRTAATWLGPDILDVIREVHGEGVRRVLVAPIGFVSDHLEILYDIDIECRKLADELGMRLERIESLNEDPRYIAVLADVVSRLAAESAE